MKLKSLKFYIIGLSSLIWFLIRVIPKPSRAAYPCMKAAAPLASSFVLYILGISGSIFSFKIAKKSFANSKYLLFSLFLLLSIIFSLTALINYENKTYALTTEATNIANETIGFGRGVMPGRVAWVHNPDATNEAYFPYTTFWMDDDNTNQLVVTKMVSDAIQSISNTNSDERAWEEIFKYHNQNHSKGNVGYTQGEKIVIKVNLNSNRSKYNSGEYVRKKKQNIDTSPQAMHAVLDQLINIAGVAQEDISIGDPGRNFDDKFYNILTQDFPDVHYWGVGNGRTPFQKTSDKVIFCSDGGYDDWLPQCYVDASYMINIPVFKKHHRAGISLACKNHFGTFVPFHGNAFNWHYSLPVSEGGGDVNNPGYGLYRCFVDIMGHKDLGDKTILYLFDALWCTTNNANPPIKWRMEPFNNDYPSSIFASMDPVAIESVGYDFLWAEFGPDHPIEGPYDPQDNKGPFPRYSGVDDYLHQAADSVNWADGIVYDPENDGIPLPRSMGVHEHWNNVTEKKYSRNLGLNEGIELVYVQSTTALSDEITIVDQYHLKQNYPNPFNPTTTIEFSLPKTCYVKLSIYDISGKLVKDLINNNYSAGTYSTTWDGRLATGKSASSGVYIYTLKAGNIIETKTMILEK